MYILLPQQQLQQQQLLLLLIILKMMLIIRIMIMIMITIKAPHRPGPGGGGLQTRLSIRALVLSCEPSRSYLTPPVDSGFAHGENCRTRNALGLSLCSGPPAILNKSVLKSSETISPQGSPCIWPWVNSRKCCILIRRAVVPLRPLFERFRDKISTKRRALPFLLFPLLLVRVVRARSKRIAASHYHSSSYYYY